MQRQTNHIRQKSLSLSADINVLSPCTKPYHHGDQGMTLRRRDSVGEIADEVLRMSWSGEARRLRRFITQFRSLDLSRFGFSSTSLEAN